MRKLKIIHVIQSIVIHGAEKIVVDMALYQKKCGHDVTVISQYAKWGNEYEKILENSGVRVIYFGKPVGFDLKHMIALTRFLKKEKPDVVHTHLHAAIYLLPYYMTDRKCAKVHTVHSVATYELGKFHRILQGFAYKFLGEVPVSISKSVEESMIDEYRSLKNPPVIYNGIATEDFNLPKIKHDGFVFINVASHTDVKNQSMLLKSFKKALDTRKDLHLLLVGDGPNRNKLENEVCELGIVDNVEFLGIRHDIAELLSKSDVFVLSSDTEGMPLSILEAFSIGLPVISTDVGGARDVIKNNENGFIIPVNDSDAMAEKMILLAEDNKLLNKISDINKEYAKKFDFKIMNEEYISLYKSLIKR